MCNWQLQLASVRKVQCSLFRSIFYFYNKEHNDIKINTTRFFYFIVSWGALLGIG